MQQSRKYVIDNEPHRLSRPLSSQPPASAEPRCCRSETEAAAVEIRPLPVPTSLRTLYEVWATYNLVDCLNLPTNRLFSHGDLKHLPATFLPHIEPPQHHNRRLA